MGQIRDSTALWPKCRRVMHACCLNRCYIIHFVRLLCSDADHSTCMKMLFCIPNCLSLSPLHTKWKIKWQKKKKQISFSFFGTCLLYLKNTIKKNEGLFVIRLFLGYLELWISPGGMETKQQIQAAAPCQYFFTCEKNCRTSKCAHPKKNATI